MDNNCGIYAITNKINNKKYIGSSIHINERFIMHKRELNNGCHYNRELKQDWNKYKEENFTFEILELCLNDNLVKKEQEYINKFKTFIPEFGYNKATPYKKGSIKPKRVNYILIIDEKIIKQLKIAKIEEGRSGNEIVEEALKNYFKKHGKEIKK